MTNSHLRSLVVILFLLFCGKPLSAQIDFAVDCSLAFPKGGIYKTAFGKVGKGITVRASKNIRSSLELLFQGQLIDLGHTEGFTQRGLLSDANLKTDIDSYIVSLGPGISLAKDMEIFMVYCTFSGGVCYYSSLERIYSPDRITLIEHMKTSTITWRAGGGFGVRTMLWLSDEPVSSRLIDAFYWDMRVDYYASGSLKYLDWLSARYVSEEILYDYTQSNINGFMISVGLGIRF